ncbi:hypothetical protein FB451DRAFT_1562514 [Mycena latifolia]|nr:hypothetical protein FB451DRAFT_1562514 [Mycena latifolia]
MPANTCAGSGLRRRLVARAENKASHVRLYRGGPRLRRLPRRARSVRRLGAGPPRVRGARAALARETCERAAVALLAGVLVPSVIRLHFLLAVSTHYAHLVASTTTNGGYRSGECDCCRSRRTCARRTRCTRLCMRARAEVWVRAPPRRMRGCSTRVVQSKHKWI